MVISHHFGLSAGWSFHKGFLEESRALADSVACFTAPEDAVSVSTSIRLYPNSSAMPLANVTSALGIKYLCEICS